ncbi:Cytochrome P450 monooxygenase [Cladobotryum mycophilum]|uniref:Cytochrome P450 monooxygenase n=1 Tax=Cladobotryum mycophilum TaxID=491253 RepID=A0ABR0S829_9HYPO
MRGPSAGTVRWLLLSDLHFKHHDLDRVRQTAQWIVAEAERNQVRRVVVCGDLLTSRTMQPTHVLSACYRFIGLLSEAVPRVHIVLGNHDLAYRRDYQTTALDALNINRLAPYVSLHSGIAHHEWDGRRVLLLPFREEQDELTEAVATLDPNEASKTVAFAHLAINKAIMQRYVVGAGVDKLRAENSITHRGLMGPDRFASLARTFTGHFHSHQTITQEQFGRNKVHLRGSVTYLGSPLQLSWADLYDEQRGVILFDPETLEHEMLINPHAVGYTTADLRQVLDGQVDEGVVTDKHVMLIGELTHLKYVTARDRLLSLGVRSVRNWTPMGFALHADRPSFGGLGASVPASDAAVQPSEVPAKDKTGPDATSDGVSGSNSGAEPWTATLNLALEAREYVKSLELDESLLLRQDELVRVGQRMIQVSREVADQDCEAEIKHRDFLDGSSQAIGTRTATELAGPSTHVFVAEPRTLTITNFLSVQGTITIDFRKDLPRGLTFLVGDNGSGKSTLVEAMVWCQFGRCIRSGLAANDVVNDNVGKNCSVMLEFANGYTIARHRKHKSHSNRVIISLRGEPQPQLEHPDTRTTQGAINELLGTDYETYVRAVVLGHESAVSFLNSTLAQRRDLIEASLGLSMLDQCGQVSRLLLRDVDNDVDEVKGKLEGLLRKIEYIERRCEDLDRTQKRFEKEAGEAVTSLEAAIQEHAAAELQINGQGPFSEEYLQFRHKYPEIITDIIDCERQISAASKGVQGLLRLAQPAELSMGFHVKISTLQDQIYIEQENLQRLGNSYARIQEQKHAEPASWLGQLQRQISQRLEAMAAAHPTGLRKLLHALKTSILCFRLMAVRGLLRISGILRDGSEGTSAQDHNQEAAINNLRKDVENSTSRLQNLKHEVNRIIALEKLATNHAVMIKARLAKAIQAQNACEALRQQVTLKQRDVATYTRLVETEQSSLRSLRSEHDALATKLEELAADRELFAFWSSALAKRTRRASSSSSTRCTAKATANFREHVLVKSLSELNVILAQVLTVLYDDTRHARVMTTGMLRSLFDSDSVDAMMNTSFSSSSSVLDRTLAVHPSLAYGKRSGGERKRIDLALFFALLQLAWARSAHRAHYVLVDEVFDSLDEAGQAAVVRWCGLMSQTMVDWIVVITHSRFLVERDLEEDTGKVLVMRARMGRRVVQEVLGSHLPTELPATKEKYHSVKAFHLVLRLVSFIAARHFVGSPLCEDEGWLSMALAYTENAFKTIILLRIFPDFMKPLVAWFIPFSYQVSWALRKAKRIVIPLIVERHRRQETDPNYERPEDFLQYIMDGASNSDGDPEKLAHRLLILTLAAVHTTSMAATQTLFDLCAHPEYIEPLRREIMEVLDEEGGYTKQTLTNFKKLDSFMRESQRLNPPSLLGFKRAVRQSLTLSDGTFLPEGVRLMMPIYPIVVDPEVTPDPYFFDGYWHFSNRQKPGQSTRHQFATTSDNNLHFGHRKYACPGRFLAANSTKMVLSNLLLGYDFRFSHGTTQRPSNIHLHEYVFPDPEAGIEFKVREEQSKWTLKEVA